MPVPQWFLRSTVLGKISSSKSDTEHDHSDDRYVAGLKLASGRLLLQQSPPSDFLLVPTFLPRKVAIDNSKLNPQSKLGMFCLATGRMYLANVTSDLCPVCSRICHGCKPFSAALVQ